MQNKHLTKSNSLVTKILSKLEREELSQPDKDYKNL